jgi:uncharacterized protein with NRDE domain
MCLVVLYARTVPGAPLVVAANRDELRTRPALPMDVLSDGEPRILGGRDLLAHGTWLAVNEWGVVAALTNDPQTLRKPDPGRRSRGEIPLMLARHRTAKEAADALLGTLRGGEFNACFVVVGDRNSLQYVAVGESAPSLRELSAGIHVLENLPLEAPSRKVDLVRRSLPAPTDHHLLHRLWAGLQNRAVPAGAPDPRRPPASEAAYVELGPYGTRWSGLVVVSATGRPRVLFSEQPLKAGEGPECARWAATSPPIPDRSSSDSRT